MKNFLLVLFLISLGTGCASFNKQPLDANAAATLKDQTISHNARNKPDFAALTAGKAAFALLGAIAMISEGNSIVEQNHVDDPANKIATSLENLINSNLHTHSTNKTVNVEDEDTARISSAAKGNARFIIDTQTINWSFGYFPTNWNHYRVIYTSKTRLIDTQTNSVIAEGFCKHIPDSDTNAPTYDELLANEASLLKKQLDMIADECIETIRKDIFANLPATQQVTTATPPANAAPVPVTHANPAPASPTLVEAAPAPGNNTPNAATVAHQLSGLEIQEHFARYKRLKANQTQKNPFDISIKDNGFVQRDCSGCRVRNGDGRMSIDVAKAEVCFDWNAVTYPTSGCFKVEQVTTNSFVFHLNNGKETINYSVTP